MWQNTVSSTCLENIIPLTLFSKIYINLFFEWEGIQYFLLNNYVFITNFGVQVSKLQETEDNQNNSILSSKKMFTLLY